MIGIPGSVLICKPVELKISKKMSGRSKLTCSFNSRLPRKFPDSLYIEQYPSRLSIIATIPSLKAWFVEIQLSQTLFWSFKIFTKGYSKIWFSGVWKRNPTRFQSVW